MGVTCKNDTHLHFFRNTYQPFMLVNMYTSLVDELRDIIDLLYPCCKPPKIMFFFRKILGGKLSPHSRRINGTGDRYVHLLLDDFYGNSG